VGEEGLGFGEIKFCWTPLMDQGAINETPLADFKLLRCKTSWAAGNWSDALGQILESIQKLIVAHSQVEIQIGNPGVLGANVGVVNTFHELRHIMEFLGDAQSKFLMMPYADLVKPVKKLDQSVTHFTTTDPWVMETTEVRQMIGKSKQNLLLLQDSSVGPLVSMYNY
jgi:hypothetical protein